MSNVDKLLDQIADAQEDVDYQIEIKSLKFKDRLTELLENPAERDPNVWEELEVPADWALPALMEIPLYQRDMGWMNACAQTLAACRIQAWAEIFGAKALLQYGENGVKIQQVADKLSVDELKEAAKKRDMKSRVAKAREKKHAKESS